MTGEKGLVLSRISSSLVSRSPSDLLPRNTKTVYICTFGALNLNLKRHMGLALSSPLLRSMLRSNKNLFEQLGMGFLVVEWLRLTAHRLLRTVLYAIFNVLLGGFKPPKLQFKQPNNRPIQDTLGLEMSYNMHQFNSLDLTRRLI